MFASQAPLLLASHCAGWKGFAMDPTPLPPPGSSGGSFAPTPPTATSVVRSPMPVPM